MKTNSTINVFVIAVFALLFLIAVTVATSITTQNSVFTLNNNQSSYTITNNANQSENFTLTMNPASGFSYSISPSFLQLDAGSSGTVTVSLTGVPSGVTFGDYVSTLVASSTVPSNTQNASLTFRKTFCKSGQVGPLEITKVSISSTGSDDTTWKPLDDITIDVRVENNGDNTTKEVQLEIGLIDDSGKNVIGDMNFISADDEKISIGSLSSDDRDEETFEFTVPADFNDGDYKLVAKAYSDKDGESKLCTDTSGDLSEDSYEPITVERETSKGKLIALSDIKIDPNPATCGDTVTLNLNAYNLGDSDQDRVKVDLSSTALNLDQSYEITRGISSGDQEPVTFVFTVPQGLQDKTYTLQLSSEYEYNRGVYKQDSDSSEPVSLTLTGCQIQVQNQDIAAVSASLTSDAVAGKEMTINARITNLGSNNTNFVISAAGYDSWAVLESVSQSMVNLAPSASQDVTLKFMLKSEVSGEQSFTLGVTGAGKQVTKQIAVNVAKSSSSGTSGFNFSDQNLIWIIVGVNVILIIIIIIVAVRVARR